MTNSISIGKTVITSYPEYFEIKDHRKWSRNLFILASCLFILGYLVQWYGNGFDFKKMSYFNHVLLILWLIILTLQLRINIESKIEKSKIKQIIVRKNRWNTIAIHYDGKKREIDGFNQKEVEEILKFLMSNK